MSVNQVVLNEAESRAVRRGVPDPGIALPQVAWPTVALWTATFVAWVVSVWGYLTHDLTLWVVIPVLSAVTFLMFTVLHEATHHAAGRITAVNEWLGRLSAPFVMIYATFPLVRFIHIEHHRNTNEDIHTDPDAWTSHGPWWQLPLRWASIDVGYFNFYAKRLRSRPVRELVEVFGGVIASVLVFVVALAAGHGMDFVLLILIPQRLGLTILSWWFDWLPHHGLEHTQRENRFQATRIRVGAEWAVTPIMMYQNYHLVHHLHPAIPFYRYMAAWEANEEAYLVQDVPISTAWGRELSVSEYRQWRHLSEAFTTSEADAPGERDHDFRPLAVKEIRRLTPDSVSIEFEVSEAERDTYAFVPGQHVVVRTKLDGQDIRRTYSICAVAGSGTLRIAVKRIENGAFSHFANDELAAGDVLEVGPPAGRFILSAQAEDRRHYGAIVAGSGITPVLSMLSTALFASEDAVATLVYCNATRASTMFADELEMLARTFEGRLRIVHVISRETVEAPTHSDASIVGVAEALAQSHEQFVAGKLDGTVLRASLGDRLARVDEWFVCGPQDLVDLVDETLGAEGVSIDRIHRELFFVEKHESDLGHTVPAELAITIDGVEVDVPTDGKETLLEAALRAELDPPYACAGGACGTCRAKIVFGEVVMDTNYALTAADVDSGYVLTCQSRPTTRRISVDYDA